MKAMRRLLFIAFFIAIASQAFANRYTDSLYDAERLQHFKEIKVDEWYEEWHIVIDGDLWDRRTPAIMRWCGYRSYKDWYLHGPDWA